MNNLTLPAKAARLWGVLPLAETSDGSIRVATTQPQNEELLENLAAWFGCPVQAVRWNEAELNKAIDKRYGFGAEAMEESLVRYVDEIIKEAHRKRATDIHLEPFGDELILRFRIDGLLHPIPVPPLLAAEQSKLFSRIKVMAQMDIAERRFPQDGRLHATIDGTELDIRVSTIPTIHGESLDLRLLPRDRLILGLEDLGMTSELLEKVAQIIHKPNGIFLVTGPTGHGKTTTLYACLSRINTCEKKIIALEDPVEYQLKGVNQMQVRQKIGLDFSTGLRSVLRQDPDVIMLGEIRDKDTADIAVRASLTGHLVFSTLHTTDSTGAIARLMDMGVEPYLVASSLQAVLAQRLVRLVCSFCSGQAGDCEKCLGTGYRGRTGLFELLTIDDTIRSLIQERAPAAELKHRALLSGMSTLFQEGVKKIEARLTTREEVLRVTEES